MPEQLFCVVTGASSGIGETYARALARRGNRVVLVARRAERLAALAAELGGDTRALAIPMDLAADGAPRALCEELRRRGIAVDLLVNNAGVGTTGRFAEEPPETTANILALDVRAMVELTRGVLPQMLERRSGAVVNVVSMSAFQPVPFLATYAASKAFALSFTESLAEELRGRGVTVQALCPGRVVTEFQKRAGTDRVAFERVPAQTPEFVVEASLRALESGRLVVIPGLRDRASVFLQRVTPRALVRRVAGSLFRPPARGDQGS